jgi:acyl-CoA synthetase (AMP-forming)/AMP-acid ligase II
VSGLPHVRNAVERFAQRVALIEGDRRWTFREFDQIANHIAHGLAARLPPGSRVGMFMSNCAEYMMLQFAIERAGLVRVPLNSRYTAFEVANVIEDCGATALFCDKATAPALRELNNPGIWICTIDSNDANNGPTWQQLLAGNDRGAMRGEPGLDDLCSINYTSGSSGKPKGVMLSHRKWRNVYRNMLIDRDIAGADRLAHVGPLTHASGTYFTPFFMRGATNVIVEGGKIDALLETIERERITVFSCVPTVLTRIVNHPDVARADFSSLRWIGYGAESIQTNVLEKAIKRFGPVLTQNYGLTEAMMTCTRLTPREHFLDGGLDGGLRLGTIGRPYSFVEVELRNPDGTVVGEDEVGEITIRAEHMMEGYWGRPEETAKVLREGWLWSGDLARRDAEGFIYLMGRSKEMLISGGFNIYPQEVENCLSACPGVMEAAVIGMPDENLGEIAIAFVAGARGEKLTEESCLAYCKPLLGIKTPKRWHLIDALPRTPNGKVDKAALRRQYLNDGSAPGG